MIMMTFEGGNMEGGGEGGVNGVKVGGGGFFFVYFV